MVLGVTDTSVAAVKNILLSGVGRITWVVGTEAEEEKESRRHPTKTEKEWQHQFPVRNPVTQKTVADCALNFFFSPEDLVAWHTPQHTSPNASHSSSPRSASSSSSARTRINKKDEEDPKETSPVKHFVSEWQRALALRRGPLARLYPDSVLHIEKWHASLSHWANEWAMAMTQNFKKSAACGPFPLQGGVHHDDRLFPFSSPSSPLLCLLPTLFLVSSSYQDWSPLSPLAKTATALHIPVVYVEAQGWIGGWVQMRVTASDTKKEGSAAATALSPIVGNARSPPASTTASFLRLSSAVPLVTWSSRRGTSSSSSLASPMEENVCDLRPFFPFPALRDWMQDHLPRDLKEEEALPTDDAGTSASCSVESSLSADTVSPPPYLLLLYAGFQRWCAEKKRTCAIDQHPPPLLSIPQMGSASLPSFVLPPVLPSSPNDYHAIRLAICAMCREEEEEMSTPKTIKKRRWLAAESIREALAKCTPFHLRSSLVFPPHRLPFTLQEALFHPLFEEREEKKCEKGAPLQQAATTSTIPTTLTTPLLDGNAPLLPMCTEEATERMYLHTSLQNAVVGSAGGGEGERMASLSHVPRPPLPRTGTPPASPSLFLSPVPVPTHHASDISSSSAVVLSITAQEGGGHGGHGAREWPTRPSLASLHLVPYQHALLSWYILYGIRCFYLFSSSSSSSLYENTFPCLPFNGYVPDMHTTPAWYAALRHLYHQKHVLDLQWVVSRAWRRLRQDWKRLHVKRGEEEEEEERTPSPGPEAGRPSIASEAEDKGAEWKGEARNRKADEDEMALWGMPLFSWTPPPPHRPTGSSSSCTATHFLFLFHTSKGWPGRKGEGHFSWRALCYPPWVALPRLRAELQRLGEEMVTRVWTIRILPSPSRFPALPTPLWFEGDGRGTDGHSPPRRVAENGLSSPSLATPSSLPRASSPRWVWEHLHFPTHLRFILRHHSCLASSLEGDGITAGTTAPLVLSPERIDAFFAALLLVVRERKGKYARQMEKMKKKKKKMKHAPAKKKEEGTEEMPWGRGNGHRRPQSTRWRSGSSASLPHASHDGGWGRSPLSLLHALYKWDALPSWATQALFPSSSFSSAGEEAAAGDENGRQRTSRPAQRPKEVCGKQGGEHPSLVAVGSVDSSLPPAVQWLMACANEVWGQREVEVPSIAAALGALAAQEVVKLLQQHRTPACGGLFYSGYSNTVRSWEETSSGSAWVDRKGEMDGHGT